MAWYRYAGQGVDPGGTVEVVGDDGSANWLPATSKCTVNLAGTSGSDGDLFRMFGVTIDEVHNAYSSALVWEYLQEPCSRLLDGTTYEGGSDGPITYIDSTEDPDLGQRFLVEKGLSDETAPLKSTVIPSKKTKQTWFFTKVYYGIEPPDSGYMIQEGVYVLPDQTAEFDVYYKDPCVVHLPNGKGWLMLLARHRVLAGSPIPQSVDASLADIVAYWANEEDPDFKQTEDISEDLHAVRGPYWIAINLSTLGPATNGYRFWLSVPSGCIMKNEEGEDLLAVYFVAEATQYPDAYYGGTSSESFAWAYSRIGKLDRSNTCWFQSCIGVHLIKISDLEAASYGNEEVWASSASGTTYVIPRTAGRLYLWLDDGMGNPNLELVEYGSSEGVGNYLKLADPQLCRCSTDGNETDLSSIRMFSATIGRSEGFSSSIDWGLHWATHDMLLGIWMATPFDPASSPVSRVDGDSTPTTMAGFDYLLTTDTNAEDESSTSTHPHPTFEPGLIWAVLDDADAIEHGGGSAQAYAWQAVDPDPVFLSDGTVRVHYGISDDARLLGGAVADPNPPLSEERNSEIVCSAADSELPPVFFCAKRTPANRPPKRPSTSFSMGFLAKRSFKV